MVEYQVRITGRNTEKDIPLEASDSGYAMIKAHKALYFIRDSCRDGNNINLNSLVEVVRHDKDYIEQQPIWCFGLGYLDNRKGFNQ